MSEQEKLRLFRFALSGHCHRVELFASLMELPVELVEIDLRTRAQKSAEFLALNPFGQVPVLEDGDVHVADSNAILLYLAGKFGDGSWFPRDSETLAGIVRWFSVASGPVAQSLAAARAAHVFKRPFDVEPARAQGRALLTVFESELGARPFLLGESPSLADIANYTYIAHAPEGGISLEPFQSVRAWLARIEALPGFIPMMRSAPPSSASDAVAPG